MKKKALFIFFTFLSLFTALVLTIYFSKMHNEVRLPGTEVFEMFDGTGAEFVNSQVIFKADVEDKRQQLNQEFLNKITGDLINGLELEADVKISENDRFKQMVAEGETREGEFVNITLVLEKDDLYKDANYAKCSVEVCINGTRFLNRLEDIYHKIYTVFGYYKLKPKVSSMVAGYFEGKMDTGSMNRVCEAVLGKIKPENVKSSAEKNLITVYADLPVKGNNDGVQDGRNNIHVSFRYNSYEKRTYIWIRIPAA